VDGRPVPLVRANVALMALRVPVGGHDVLLAYEPPWLPWALASSATGFVLALGALVLGLRRR
jgi:uncharacterized membrane protein YfhO